MTKIPATMLKNPIHLLSLGFGSGLAPKAPGTCGTLVAIPFYLLMGQMPLAPYIALVVVGFIVGVFLCEQTSKALGVHDHPGIVWDEFVGFWLTMIAVPMTWYWIILGFVLFRFFDIFKPWPVKIADQKLKGGFGIMIDDVLAGIYALVCMQLILHFVV
ncbi:MAG: phosphatidylglycerophosphatase A [Pseudomonadota bacterium]